LDFFSISIFALSSLCFRGTCIGHHAVVGYLAVASADHALKNIAYRRSKSVSLTHAPSLCFLPQPLACDQEKHKGKKEKRKQ
jgi:hypothetical protein